MRVLAVLVVSLLFAATAQAAPPWSEPRAISAAYSQLEPAFLGFGGDGSGLAMWNVAAGMTYDARLVTKPAAGSFGPEQTVALSTLVVYGSSSAARLREAQVGPGLATRLRVAFGRTTGAFGALRLLASYDRSPGNHASIAAGGSGDVAVAWAARPNHGASQVLVAIRRHDRSWFGTPIVLARPPRGGAARVRRTTVAVGPRGDVLVAWEQGGEVHQRYLARGQRTFASDQRLRAEESYNADPRIAIDRGGRAVMAWSSWVLSEGGGAGPFRVQVAVKAAGATRFGKATVLVRDTRDDIGSSGAPSVVLDATGAALVGYATGDRAMVATSGPGDRFAQREPLSSTPARGIVLAAGPRGQVVAAWTTAGESLTTPQPVRGAVRPAAGAAFGPEETISDPSEHSSGAMVAFDPRSGHAVAIWVSAPTGGPTPRTDHIATAERD